MRRLALIAFSLAFGTTAQAQEAGMPPLTEAPAAPLAAPAAPTATEPAAVAPETTEPAVQAPAGEAPPTPPSAPAVEPLGMPTAAFLAPVAQPPQAPTLQAAVARSRPPRRHGDAGAPFALGVGGGFVWNDDTGRLLVGPKRQSQFDLYASYDLLQPVRRVVISLGASFRHADASADLLDIRDSTLQADLLARVQVADWLWPQVRASGGAVWTHVSLKDAGLGGTIADRDVAFAATLGGGLMLRTPTRLFETYRGRLASLSFGVLSEAGYAMAPAASIQGTPSGGSSDVQRSSVQLGSLSRSGPYVRIMGVMRF